MEKKAYKNRNKAEMNEWGRKSPTNKIDNMANQNIFNINFDVLLSYYIIDQEGFSLLKPHTLLTKISREAEGDREREKNT